MLKHLFQDKYVDMFRNWLPAVNLSICCGSFQTVWTQIRPESPRPLIPGQMFNTGSVAERLFEKVSGWQKIVKSTQPAKSEFAPVLLESSDLQGYQQAFKCGTLDQGPALVFACWCVCCRDLNAIHGVMGIFRWTNTFFRCWITWHIRSCQHCFKFSRWVSEW